MRRDSESQQQAAADGDIRRGTKAKWAALAGVLLLAAAIGVYLAARRSRPLPFQNFTVSQITDTGRAEAAAISPDGKYIVNLQNDEGRQSLWLRNIATGSDTQIVPPAPERYLKLAFSPDGNYVYFHKDVLGSISHDLYRMPVLGGTAQLIARDVDSNVIFSPDGQRIAYVRGNDPNAGKYALLSASLDGSGETTLELRDIPDAAYNDFPRLLAWSVDGMEIAAGDGPFEGPSGAISV